MLVDADYSEELDISADELIDEYVEDALSTEEREQFEKHFLTSQERRDKLGFAWALKKRKVELISHKYQPKRFFTYYLPMAASILLVTGLGFGIWRAFFYQADLNKGLVALHEAFNEQRPVEARISGFNYAPAITQRGGRERVDSVQTDQAARLLLNAVADHPSADSHHALGQYHLAERQFDKAIGQFEAALRLDPRNAKIHSDLGAALLEDGKSHSSESEQDKEVEEFAKSLEQLNKALELDGSLLEALFNRALLYQSMMLPQRAEEDWRGYLKADPNSKWGDEARHNLKNLEEQKNKVSEDKEQRYLNFLNDYRARDYERAWQDVAQSSCRIGNYITEKLVDDYLSSLARGEQDEANQTFQMLWDVAEMKSQKAEDFYTTDLAGFYKAITLTQLAKINRARELIKSGQQQIALAQFAPALESHSTARQIFDEAGDAPESTLAQYWVALCQQQINHKVESASLLQSLAQECERNKYEWLRVRIFNGLATHQALLGDYSKAIMYSLRSQIVAGRSLDTYGQISALAFLMQAYLYLGNRQQTLRYAQHVLNSGFSSLEPRQRWTRYNEIAWALSSLNFNAAAIEYQKVALQLALDLQEPATICLSFTRLGAIYGKGGDYNEAFSHLRQAIKLSETYSNEPFAQQMIAYASLQLGNLYRQVGDLDQAVSRYNLCIDLYGQLNSPTFVYQAHKGKLLSLIATNGTAAVKEELNTTLELYEAYRSKIIEESNRDSFFDLEQDVYDIAIDFEYSVLKDPEKAFDYSELSKARSLLDLTRAGARVSNNSYGPDLIFRTASHPYNFAEVRERLPERAQIVQYAVLENTILIWALSRQDARVVKTEIAAKQLNERIREFQQAILRQDQDGARRSARDLYGILIQPIESSLDKNKQLYIVPDKNLNYVPFSALISPISGKYLVEDYVLASTPSSNMFLACTKMAHEKGSAPEESLLSVGNPTFDREEFADLPDLPSAAREVEKIADLYNSSPPLIGERATKRVVTSEMVKADVIHLAAHSITDETFPLRSKLLLAKDSPHGAKSFPVDGALQASEIYEMNFPRTKLVVLSACQTGGGRAFQGEGIMSMARPFMARGVPLVVTSLWAVDSEATAEMMVDFHTRRKREGLPTAEALRSAQLDMLHGERQLYKAPYYWASFNVIGGAAV